MKDQPEELEIVRPIPIKSVIEACWEASRFFKNKQIHRCSHCKKYSEEPSVGPTCPHCGAVIVPKRKIYSKRIPRDSGLISRENLKIKLEQHRDLYTEAWGGFHNLPKEAKRLVNEIGICISEVVNAQAIPAVLVEDIEAAKKKLLSDMNELSIKYRMEVTASTDYAAGQAYAMDLAKRMVYDALTQLCIQITTTSEGGQENA